ncbi:YnfU family zinc-binding protein [Mangrovibacter plantisponsor]|uniref:YnfU family zinc-binding protein n=1 Tax=Mangrovibacter plantisponsor TaxID=451513 RepID=UPI000D7110C3|nr:YnfU family zinc-binding protein [Mangrovibacter plantisponsor]
MQNIKKNTQKSFLVSIECPKCAEKSEHSTARVNKKKTLICPFCNALFLPPETHSRPAVFSLKK